MVQLSTGGPSSILLEATSLPNSGHYNKNDATKGQLPRCPAPFQNPLTKNNKKCRPFFGCPLNTGYSQTCLPPVLFSRSPKRKTISQRRRAWPRQLAHLAHLASPLRVQPPPAGALQTGPPLPTERLLPSSQPQDCSCEPSQGCGGHLYPPQPTLGNPKSLLPTILLVLKGSSPTSVSLEGPLCLRLPTEGEGAFQGNLSGLPGRSGEGFGFSRAPQTMQLFFRCKNTQKSQTSCFAQPPRQRGSVSACKAPPTPQPQEGAGPELLPARPSPVLLTLAGQPGSERGRRAKPDLTSD